MRCRFGERIFGGAYTWRGVFSEFYGIVGLMYYKDDTQFSAFFLAYSDKRRGETASIQRWILHSMSLLQHRSCQSQNNFPRKDKTYLSWFQIGAFPVIQVILQVSIADAEFEFFQKFLVFHKIQGVKHIKATLEKKRKERKGNHRAIFRGRVTTISNKITTIVVSQYPEYRLYFTLNVGQDFSKYFYLNALMVCTLAVSVRKY